MNMNASTKIITGPVFTIHRIDAEIITNEEEAPEINENPKIKRLEWENRHGLVKDEKRLSV